MPEDVIMLLQDIGSHPTKPPGAYCRRQQSKLIKHEAASFSTAPFLLGKTITLYWWRIRVKKLQTWSRRSQLQYSSKPLPIFSV